MLPIMLFRMEFSLSLAINGADRARRDISILSSTRIRPFATVFRGVKSDTPQATDPLGRIALNSSKRDEIINETTKIPPSNQSFIATTFKALEQEMLKATQIILNGTNIIPQNQTSTNSSFVHL